MTPTRLHGFAFALALAVAAHLASAAEQPGPMETVKRASDRIIATLRDPAIPREDRWSRIVPIIEENFDFLAMSQSILAQRWQSAKPHEQRQFVEYFSQYIEGTYRSRIEEYSGERVEYTGERIRGDRAAVDSVIHTDQTQIPVGYFLRRDARGAWKAYDVTIEGVSLVNSYRDTYQAIARASGMDGVIEHARQRAAALKAEGKL